MSNSTDKPNDADKKSDTQFIQIYYREFEPAVVPTTKDPRSDAQCTLLENLVCWHFGINPGSKFMLQSQSDPKPIYFFSQDIPAGKYNLLVTEKVEMACPPESKQTHSVVHAVVTKTHTKVQTIWLLINNIAMLLINNKTEQSIYVINNYL